MRRHPLLQLGLLHGRRLTWFAHVPRVIDIGKFV
jgi:hypothetical protein